MVDSLSAFKCKFLQPPMVDNVNVFQGIIKFLFSKVSAPMVDNVYTFQDILKF